MNILLKQMSILNFKGIRELTVDFNNETTIIKGANGTGKSTIFDAFTWLLFGKDSSDRKDFNIKTILAETNKAIPRIPHEVSATLLIDGCELKLRKLYEEKWTKRRGSANEEFTGHETTQFINDVPCGAKEYQTEIYQILPEHIFKLITNPLYFTAQKKDVQRATLLTMAGTVSDQEIASTNTDFAELMANLTGKTLGGYKKEIAVKKKKIKDELLVIPSRVDERKRSMPEAENWNELEEDLSTKRAEVAEIDNKMLDRSQLLEDHNNKRQELMTELNNTKNERLNLEFAIKERELAVFRAKEAKKNEITQSISTLQAQLSNDTNSMSASAKVLEQRQAEREELIADWKAINDKKLVFNEDDFACPTCKRTLDVSDIEEKQAEMTSNFNKKKAEQLKDNNKLGMALKTKIEALQGNIKACEDNIAITNEKISTLQQMPEFTELLEAPDCTPIINADAKYIELSNKITDLDNQLAQKIVLADEEELSEHKAELADTITELNKRLSKRDTIEANNKRIAELEDEQRTLSQELATLEGVEFTIAAFNKAKIEAVEDKINSLFDIVRFRMYETQVNGGEVETCEAMVNGVPFSDLNTAMKINAGIDIINAICKHHDVYAPCIIDNSESVNQLHAISSQMIQLCVTTDKTLIVE